MSRMSSFFEVPRHHTRGLSQHDKVLRLEVITVSCDPVRSSREHEFGKEYMMAFADTFSREACLYPLCRSEMAETQYKLISEGYTIYISGSAKAESPLRPGSFIRPTRS